MNAIKEGDRVQRMEGRDTRWGFVRRLVRDGEHLRAEVAWDMPWDVSAKERCHFPLGGNARSTVRVSRLRKATYTCAECDAEVLTSEVVDHGGRKKGIEYERWVCRECDEAIYDEAMGMLP